MILGFDTATPETAVALWDEPDTLLGELTRGPDRDGRPAHGRALLEMVERAVAAAGGWEPVTVIAAGIGPGSFTGIRIGVSTARALAQARRLPVVGIDSTAALAAGIEIDPPAGRDRIGIIDARRGEVFAAVDRGHGGEGPVVCPPGLLAEALGERLRDPIAAGDGALRFRAEIEAQGIEVPEESDPAHRMSARHVCRLAAKMGDAAGAGMESVVGLNPNYMRRPDAERWHERDNDT